MKKITILALHLGYGGIERAISMVANALSSEYNVEIASTYKLYDKPIFSLNENISVKYLLSDKPNRNEFIKALKKLNFIAALKEGIKAIKILKMKKTYMINYIKNCDSDIIISTRDIHNSWLGTYGSKNCLKIGWEHNHHNNNNKYINKVVKSVKNLDYFVLVSKELNDFYQSKLINTKCKCVYIPNAIDNIPSEPSSLDEKSLISIGRLSKEKGFLDLIDVYKIVHESFPEWKLNIIGDGVLRNKIEKKIDGYGLSDSVILHGYKTTDYVNKMLKSSSIYIMTSFTESFGIVLLEAFSYGIPAVSFTSARGANEIITNNWDGYLIKNRNKEEMAKRICELISGHNRRVVMGNNALKKANKFYIDEIKNKWILLIEKG